jgi:hypothetical protein
MDLTTETIKKVAAEASILSSIRHPNIVNIMGVSVLPPRYIVSNATRFFFHSIIYFSRLCVCVCGFPFYSLIVV